MNFSDAEDRLAARTRLDRNVVVEAGAGTGKTTLLTDRILFLILAGGGGGGLDVTRLAALTFTEKAAGEIKLRLAGRLEDILGELEGRAFPEEEGARRAAAAATIREAGERFGRGPKEVRESCLRALEDLERAMVGTIHHFAAHLLRLHPIEAGVDPAFQVDQGAAFDELFESRWALWLDSELGDRAPRREAWLEVLELASLEDLAELARGLASEGVRQGRIGTTPEQFARLKALAARARKIPEGKPILGAASRAPERLRAISGRLQDLLDPAPAALPERLPEPGQYAGDWPAKWKGLSGREDFEAAQAVAGTTSPAAELLLRKATALVLPFSEGMRAEYGRRGWIGYDGLLVKARNLVRDYPGAREEIKARFDALLIDEFQDTDPLQGELLLLLAERPGASAADWRRSRLGDGRIFIVGDPKQSIYRFRGADIRAYRQFTEHVLSQGGLACALKTSFRSPAGLLGPINAVFSELIKEEAGLQPAYRALEPRPDAPPSAAPSVILGLARNPEDPAGRPPPMGEGGGTPAPETPGAGRLKAAEAQELEAAWIAGWLKVECAPGKRPLKDVAILLRTTTALGVYMDALKNAGVRYVVEADRYFFGTQEAVDFLNLLRVLDDPEDRLSFAGLLRSPLVALEDRELYALSRVRALGYLTGPPSGVLGRESAKRLGAFSAVLRSLRAAAGRLPLAEFIGLVLRETLLLELGSAAYHGDQTASNLLKFTRLAAEAGEAGSTLKEFIALVEGERGRGSDEGESPLADEQLDAVRILTIHKAKGLEFPVVIVPNLGAKRGAGAGKPSRKVDWSAGTAGFRLKSCGAADLAMSFIEHDEALREEHEARRLLYVAMTRAREKLFLLGAAVPVDKSSFAALLASAGAWPGKGAEMGELSLKPGARLKVLFLEETDRAGRTAPSAEAPLSLDIPALARNRREREKARDAAQFPFFISPSALLREAEKPRRPAGEDEAAAATSAVLVGQVCHRALETWDFRSPEGMSKSHREGAAALRPLSPGADWAGIEEESRRILEGFAVSSACRDLARAEVIGREVPFSYPANGRVMRGAIDLLARQGGRLWVIDYKTDRLRPGEGPRKAAFYAPQGRAYAQAARSALGEDAGFKVIFLRTGEAVEVKI